MNDNINGNLQWKIATYKCNCPSVESRWEDDEMNKRPEYAGIYQELRDLIGEAAVYAIWNSYRGLTITFPQHIYSREFVRQYIKDNYGKIKPATIARQINLSERRVRQIYHEIHSEESKR